MLRDKVRDRVMMALKDANKTRELVATDLNNYLIDLLEGGSAAIWNVMGVQASLGNSSYTMETAKGISALTPEQVKDAETKLLKRTGLSARISSISAIAANSTFGTPVSSRNDKDKPVLKKVHRTHLIFDWKDAKANTPAYKLRLAYLEHRRETKIATKQAVASIIRDMKDEDSNLYTTAVYSASMGRHRSIVTVWNSVLDVKNLYHINAEEFEAAIKRNVRLK